MRTLSLQITYRKGKPFAAAARTMWNRNEHDKARILADLTEYVLAWRESSAPECSDLEMLKQWAATTCKRQFVREISGLGPRAFEQLLWHIDGVDAIRLDRHVVSFVEDVIRRRVGENHMTTGLRTVAKNMGVSPTELDARIWDYMQRRSIRGGMDDRVVWACP